MSKKIIQLLLLNGGIALVNIVAFSEALLGISIPYGNTIQQASGITLIIMSIIVFFWGNYRILNKTDEATKELQEAMATYGYVLEEIDTPEECVEALAHYRNTTFAQYVNTASDQIHRLVRKRSSLKEILYQKCQAQQGELLGFQKVIDDSEKLIYENIKKMLSRMAIFDQQEYEQLNYQQRMHNISSQVVEAKKLIFAEHFAYIKQQVEKNEAILLEFDRLLMEISKIGDEPAADEETMNGIRDVIFGMQRLHTDENLEMDKLEQKYQVEESR